MNIKKTEIDCWRRPEPLLPKEFPSGLNRISTVAGFRSAVSQELEIVQSMWPSSRS
jgi:hypothetical protein